MAIGVVASETAVAGRLCIWCAEPLTRRDNEVPAKFRVRQNCGDACAKKSAAASRARNMRERTGTIVQPILAMGPFLSREEAISLGVSHYFTGAVCGNGHISPRTTTTYHCIRCDTLRSRRWQKSTPARWKAWKRKKHLKKKSTAAGRASIQLATARWLANHPDQRRALWRASSARRRRSANYRIGHALRTRLSIALKNNQKRGSAISDLGCSLTEFRNYIAGRFLPRMSWDNYGVSGWHLDHIKPLASFDLTQREQFVAACHYTNYQPLWASDNCRKGARC